MKDRDFSCIDDNGEKINLVFKRPNQSQISAAEFAFKKAFADAVRAGFVTNAEVSKLLKDKEIWTENNDSKVAELRTKIALLEEKFKTNNFDGDGMTEYQEVKKLRDELNSTLAVYTSIVDNTAESFATDAKTRFYAVECSFKDGKKLFKDVLDFNSQFPKDIASSCYRQAFLTMMEIHIGVELPEVVDSESIEDKWLNSKIPTELEPNTQELPKKRGRKKINA